MRRLLSAFSTRRGILSRRCLPRNNHEDSRNGFIIRIPVYARYMHHPLSILRSPQPLFQRGSWCKNSSWALVRTVASPLSLPSSSEKSPTSNKYTGIWIFPVDRIRHPSAFTYDYAIRYHAREQALSDLTVHASYSTSCESCVAWSRLLRDRIPLKKRDIQIRSAAQSR